ncbi:MAG: hypothetical protein II574_03725 [Ruminococcus sp.]|nr:hypothetical protein [Ruminococcus sp.]
MRKTKHAALIIALMLFFVMLISAVFIAHETQHDCSGDGCGICAILAVCENMLKNISAAAAAAAVLAAAVFIFIRSIEAAAVFCPAATPVSLKVKLSD